ncbi:hypothetical protein DFP73DRAFT_548667 [Morchella snyderi]|nr:hypothetical protein DFP73DRAFT_548667 [Morchella snyderi]
MQIPTPTACSARGRAALAFFSMSSTGVFGLGHYCIHLKSGFYQCLCTTVSKRIRRAVVGVFSVVSLLRVKPAGQDSPPSSASGRDVMSGERITAGR